MFYDSFGYFILGKSISEVQFYALKLDMFTFYACNKMCSNCTLKQQEQCQAMLKLHILVKLALSAICLMKTEPIY